MTETDTEAFPTKQGHGKAVRFYSEAEMAKATGKIWSEVRWGLSMYRERLVQAFDSGSYERESAVLDEVARRITDRIQERALPTTPGHPAPIPQTGEKP